MGGINPLSLQNQWLMTAKTRWDHSDMLLVTSTCNDCSSDLSYTLESQDSKYSDEQSKIKKKILPPCSWMKVFLWLCCPQWTLLVPAPRGTAAPAFPKSRSIPDLQPPRDTGWSPAEAEVAMDGPLLWAALSQWGLDSSPQQEQGWDLRLWCLSAGKYALLFHGVRQKLQSRE